MNSISLSPFAAAVLSSALFAGSNQRTAEMPTIDREKAPAPGQSLRIAGVPNLRDIGGYLTCSGAVVQRGLVYRSSQLNPVSSEDLEQVALLKLKNDFDLRTEEEARNKPDEIPPGVKYHLLNVLADTPFDPTLVQSLLQEPQKANKALGGGRIEAMLTQVYRDFVSLPSANEAYREMLTSLGNPDRLPALFHCTAGKDRTGWGAAALLMLLGVPKETVMADFLRSNDYIFPARRNEIDAFVAAGGDPSIPQVLFGVKPKYLDAALDEMKQRYGTIENYFADALGIDAACQRDMRELYLNSISCKTNETEMMR
jgi:protein-tyrosine phosphatase